MRRCRKACSTLASTVSALFRGVAMFSEVRAHSTIRRSGDAGERYPHRTRHARQGVASSSWFKKLRRRRPPTGRRHSGVRPGQHIYRLDVARHIQHGLKDHLVRAKVNESGVNCFSIIAVEHLLPISRIDPNTPRSASPLKSGRRPAATEVLTTEAVATGTRPSR